MNLATPTTTEKNRSISYDWLLKENEDGSRVVAELSCHHFGAPSKCYTATLHQVTASDEGLFSSRCYNIMDGERIATEKTARYSAKALKEFAEKAKATVERLLEEGHEKVTAKFTIEKEKEDARFSLIHIG